MDQSELMNHVVDALDRRGIVYAITGSHASSVFGVPERTDWPDQFARRIKISVQPNREIWFIAPEDLILKKMDFYREGGDPKNICATSPAR